MEKYKELLKEISKTSAEIKNAKKCYKKIENHIDGNSPLERAKNRKKVKKDLETLYKKDLETLYKKECYLNLVLKLQRYNLQVAALDELTPIIIRVLEKYQNKQYGPRTKEKICDKFKELTGFYIGLYDKGFYTEIYTSDMNSNFTLKINTKNDIKALENNRIQVITSEDLWAYGVHDYVDDIPAHIEKMKEAYTALQARYKEFDAAMHNYNDLCKGDIETIPYYYLNTVWDMQGM